MTPETSKQALVFPITHSTSAICYLLMDALNTNTDPKIRYTRMSGVLLWLNYAVSQLFFALKDLSLQKIANRPLLNFLLEIDFLAAGILVTTTNLLQRPMPFALTGSGCWLVAGILDICRTYQEWREQVSTNIINPSAVNLSKPKSSLAIEVLDDSKPQLEMKR